MGPGRPFERHGGLHAIETRAFFPSNKNPTSSAPPPCPFVVSPVCDRCHLFAVRSGCTRTCDTFPLSMLSRQLTPCWWGWKSTCRAPPPFPRFLRYHCAAACLVEEAFTRLWHKHLVHHSLRTRHLVPSHGRLSHRVSFAERKCRRASGERRHSHPELFFFLAMLFLPVYERLRVFVRRGEGGRLATLRGGGRVSLQALKGIPIPNGQVSDRTLSCPRALSCKGIARTLPLTRKKEPLLYIYIDTHMVLLHVHALVAPQQTGLPVVVRRQTPPPTRP